MHQINNLTPELLSYNQYDQLGQLLVKNVGGTDPTGANVLQRVNYKYNIRGWLKEINDVNALQQGSDPLDLFAFKIGYHEIAGPSIAGVHELYNGNIAETYWKTSSDNVLRKYSYAYDELNRLKEAVYQKPTWNNPVTNNYNESLTYDKNGNILTLQRNGALDDPIFTTQIDDLEYTYHPQIKNQLQRVRDNSASPEGFVDGNTQGDDYLYDANGNMIADANKGIERIWYNHLNLPVRILFSNSGNIYYRYNAQGVKVQKRVVQNGTTTTTDYLTGYQYVDEKLQFFPHAEGYVKQSLNRFEVPFFHYVYNYTDHLGNIRLSYTLDPQTHVLTLLEENHYYPFGLKHKNYNTTKKKFIDETELNPILIVETPNAGYQYKYNGKEWQDELGLNVTAMDFRMYDNALGRFYNIDPMTEIMPSLSPNRFAFNNPVVWKDPSGLLEVNEDEIPVIALEEVVVSAKGKSSKSVHDTGLPGNHNYWMMPKNYRAVSTEYYNKKYGTDFKSFDDWYYRTKYLPFKQEMIYEMHAAQAKAGQAVMALVGSVFVLPILVASSPAAISAFSATISHPLTQYSFSMGLSSAFSQQLVNGEVDQADVAVSMIPGGAGVQILKPMFSAAIDFNSISDYSFIGGKGNMNKSYSSFYRDAATGYIFHGLSFGASPANDLRSLGEIPLNTVLNTGQNLMSNLLEKDGWE